MEQLVIKNGWIEIYSGFLSEQQSNKLYACVLNESNWQQEEICLFGKKHKIPRLEAFYTDTGKSYGYSGKRLENQPLLACLKDIQQLITEQTGYTFNSILANLYRHGMDSNGWHADDEKELGKNPLIASLSLGATRKFQFKHKLTDEKLNFDLANGDLMIMGGELQHHWKHQLPKMPKLTEGRINLTFRTIH